MLPKQSMIKGKSS